MRNLVLALLSAGGLAMVGAAPAEAVGTRYPYCIQGSEIPGLSQCSFTSYEQCQATASGGFSPASKIPITIPVRTEIRAPRVAATAYRRSIPGNDGASEGGTDA